MGIEHFNRTYPCEVQDLLAPLPVLLGEQVGRHGIVINFRDKHNQPYSATYLPEVAAEQSECHPVCLLCSPKPSSPQGTLYIGCVGLEGNASA